VDLTYEELRKEFERRSDEWLTFKERPFFRIDEARNFLDRMEAMNAPCPRRVSFVSDGEIAFQWQDRDCVDPEYRAFSILSDGSAVGYRYVESSPPISIDEPYTPDLSLAWLARESEETKIKLAVSEIRRDLESILSLNHAESSAEYAGEKFVKYVCDQNDRAASIRRAVEKLRVLFVMDGHMDPDDAFAFSRLAGDIIGGELFGDEFEWTT
jgi:hypothetical protein